MLGQPIDGLTHALCFPVGLAAPNYVTIQLARPAKEVRITIVAENGVEATAYDSQGHELDTFEGGLPGDPHLEITVEELDHVVLHSKSEMCILKFCVVLGPNPDEVARLEEMAKHLQEEMARWSQEGEVLEPHTTYRLKVVTTIKAEGEDELAGESEDHTQTEYAYFRTEGPPGLTKLLSPPGHPNPDEFNSGLDDLTHYVCQTVPATVPDAGEKQPLPRPVYRAYDVGVEFDEECRYVELMYHLEKRDLGLYLYDNNNRPVRDAQGRLIVLSNRWGETEELTLTESEERWITIVNASDCAVLDTTVIPHEKTLTSSAEGQVLDPDTVYEARLVPLLLHEDFGADVYETGDSINGPSGFLNGWFVHDETTNQGPSHWEIREEGMPLSRHIVQTSNVWGGTQNRNDPVKPGTMLLRADTPQLAADHPDQPSQWTDYRLSVFLYTKAPEDDAIGIVFRYIDSDNYYRFSIDRQRKYRRVVSVLDGTHTILAEDDFVYRQDQDYLITIEAIGSLLRVYQDEKLIFAVSDDSIARGSIGLYCWGNSGARFKDVRVDDFSKEAPIVYRFKFTASQFANFIHHLHSFQDETWREGLETEDLSDSDLNPLIAKAVLLTDVSSRPNEEEARAYHTLAEHVLGQAALQNPTEVQVTRVQRNGETLAFLVQSPEPIDWERVRLEVLRLDHHLPHPEAPDVAKLTDVTFGATQPNEESLTVLLRKAADLTGYRIEYRKLPGPVAELTGDPVLFVDEFEGEEGGLLFSEAFGPNALDHYTIIDEGTISAHSAWSLSDGHIVQTSNIYGGDLLRDNLDKPGTVALTGSASWTGVRIRVTLWATDNDAIGIVFRYQDADNYYRFSMDSQRNYRRLVKKVSGTMTLLWEDDVSYTLDRSYRLVIEAYHEQIVGYLDDVLLFSIRDTDVSSGQVGFYCWGNNGAHFEALSIEALESLPVLWQPEFADLDEVEIIDEPGAIDDPSEWGVEDGVLIQSSNIHVEDDTPYQPGTFALGGNEQWKDVQISVRLRSDTEGAIGVMFRVPAQVSPEADESEEVQDYNYYRFSMSRVGNYRRLIKKVGDTVSVLWEDTVQYTVGQGYEITIRAVGSELRGYLDGASLFTVHDGDLKQGRIGFYCSSNTGARFERVVITDRTRHVNRWTIVDEGMINGPSVWQFSNEALVQNSNIHGGSEPDYPGTYAVIGDPVWADYRMIVQIRSDDNDGIGMMLRYKDQDNYYRLSLDAQRNCQLFTKRENGEVTTFWNDANGYIVGEPFTLTVDAIGSRLVGYMNGNPLFDITDDTHLAGQVGLYCWGNNGARFERVEVRRPPLEAYALLRDRFGENDTSGWDVVDEGTVAAPSNWSTFEGALRQTSNIYSPPNDRDTLDKKGTYALGGDPAWEDIILSARVQSLDNDVMGVMFRYQDANNYYRFSIDSQRRYRRLVKNLDGNFNLLWEDDFAYEIGRVYELTIVAIGSMLRGYMDGVLMFVIEDNDLAEGRIGLYCWGNDDTRFSNVRVYGADKAFADWLLEEPFDFLIPGRWKFVDEGDHEGPSQWDVTDGELRQTSQIFGGSTEGSEPDKPGTYALGGDETWSDYRLSIRLTSNDTDGAIGAMFHFRDANNYYRFSMDSELRYRRLLKKVAGEVTILWEDDVQYTVGREYILTVECVGERIIGYLDGVALFTVEDSDLAAGRIGLYCWRNAGARFAEVRVSAPVWTNYYTFGSEVRMPVGTRVKVYAGNVIEEPTDDTDVVKRFIASLDENGQLRFPAKGVDLRIVRPNSSIIHSRSFLPEHEYSPVDTKVLRKADGTGFFIFAFVAETEDDINFSTGQYRLKMSYRRDNRQVDPDSQVFSQSGRSGPEIVKLEIFNGRIPYLPDGSDGNGAQAPPFLTKWGSQGTGDGQFNSPAGVVVDGSGNVYVADLLNHRIQKFGS